MFNSEDGYSYKSDVFSLGAVFFNLITGRYLFSGEDFEQTLRRNVRCDVASINKYLEHTSNNCKDLLASMLKANPVDRPSAQEALQHVWFNNDKGIIRDLLLMNEIMCEDDKVQRPSQNHEPGESSVDAQEFDEENDSQSDISHKLQRLCRTSNHHPSFHAGMSNKVASAGN